MFNDFQLILGFPTLTQFLIASFRLTDRRPSLLACVLTSTIDTELSNELVSGLELFGPQQMLHFYCKLLTLKWGGY